MTLTRPRTILAVIREIQIVFFKKVLKHIILESNQVCAKKKGVSNHNTKSLTDWLIVGSVFVEYHTSCMLKTSFLEFK